MSVRLPLKDVLGYNNSTEQGGGPASVSGGVAKPFQIPQDTKTLFPGSQGKKIWQVNRAIFEGVKKAYLLKKLPFTETILPKLDERNLGQLLEMKMIEIIFLAKLMEVNAFDQPGVELYKRETRKILQK